MKTWSRKASAQELTPAERGRGPLRWVCKQCGKERRRGECLHCGNTKPLTNEQMTPGVVR